MTGFGTPSPHSREEEIEASERVVEARQARHEIGRDDPAPSVEAILREMGRDADGYRIAEGPDGFVPASTAARRATARIDPTVDLEEVTDS